jgi:nucleotide-binding universal stress UspA family protein
MLPTRHILYATDFSEASLAAFQVACALAREPGSQLLILHVLMPPTLSGRS